ncbi:hypothetical protein [Paenibacillus alkaliterrae]|nr:hypothetical protein [Paenibacillus alkaliterrae]
MEKRPANNTGGEQKSIEKPSMIGGSVEKPSMVSTPTIKPKK